MAASTASRHARDAPTTRRPVAAPAPRRATPPQVRGVSSAGPSAQPSSEVERRVARSSPPLRARGLGAFPERGRSELPDARLGRPEPVRSDELDRGLEPERAGAPDRDDGPERGPEPVRPEDEPPEDEPPEDRDELEPEPLLPPRDGFPPEVGRPELSELDRLEGRADPRPAEPELAPEPPLDPPFELPFAGPDFPDGRPPPRGPFDLPERDELEEEGLAMRPTYRSSTPTLKTSPPASDDTQTVPGNSGDSFK